MTQPKFRRFCAWRACTTPATMTITAGTPGTGHYYTGAACDLHQQRIRNRALQTTGGAHPVQTEPISNPQEQLTLDT